MAEEQVQKARDALILAERSLETRRNGTSTGQYCRSREVSRTTPSVAVSSPIFMEAYAVLKMRGCNSMPWTKWPGCLEVLSPLHLHCPPLASLWTHWPSLWFTKTTLAMHLRLCCSTFCRPKACLACRHTRRLEAQLGPTSMATMVGRGVSVPPPETNPGPPTGARLRMPGQPPSQAPPRWTYPRLFPFRRVRRHSGRGASWHQTELKREPSASLAWVPIEITSHRCHEAA